MKTKHTLALTAAATLAGVAALGAGQAWADPSAPPPTFEGALAEAKAAGKPLVLEFWASW
jgi:hypothetical protein